MKFRFILVVFPLLGIVLAEPQVLPDCAARCFGSSLEAQSVCKPTDQECICTNAPLNAAIQTCVGQTCTVKETLVALNVTSTTCDRPVRDRTQITNILCGVTGGLAILAVILRTANAFVIGRFEKDDATALAAGVFVIIDNAVTFPTGPAGFGRDVWTVPFDNITFILKMIYLMQNFYWPISALTKITFLLFYLRIFPGTLLRKCVFAMMGLTLCYYVTFQFGNIFYCHPISLVWNGWDGEHEGHCLDINKFMVAATAVNILIDIVIIVLPIPELIKLSLSWRKKIGLILMFTVGGFTLIVSIIRIQSILNYAKSQNGTYDNVPAGYWSLMEVNIGVFCVCMPAIRRVLGQHLPRLFGSTNGSAAQAYSPNGAPKDTAHKPWGRKRTFGASLLDETIITKTVEHSVVTQRNSDDEIVLIDVGPQKRAVLDTRSQSSRSTAGSGV